MEELRTKIKYTKYELRQICKRAKKCKITRNKLSKELEFLDSSIETSDTCGDCMDTSTCLSCMDQAANLRISRKNTLLQIDEINKIFDFDSDDEKSDVSDIEPDEDLIDSIENNLSYERKTLIKNLSTKTEDLKKGKVLLNSCDGCDDEENCISCIDYEIRFLSRKINLLKQIDSLNKDFEYIRNNIANMIEHYNDMKREYKSLEESSK